MENRPGTQDIAQLMAAFRTGDADAASKLVEIFYPELRRIAGMQIKGERKDHTLQATALVNELYLELVRIRRLDSGSMDAEVERTSFLRLAGYLMRRLLIHHARPLSKRVDKVELDDRLIGVERGEDLARDVDRALDHLGSIDPKLRQVVEMKVFEGLTIEEMAARLDCSVRTVARHWNFGKRWLETELASVMGTGQGSSGV
jgi:RNA polymerase sigma factor (TIGR02999 family)